MNSDAAPPLMLLVPRTVVPFLKVTVPVGVPDTVDLTVAVNLTNAPNSAGFKEETNVVVVEFSTTCVTADEVLVVKYVAPL